MEWTSPTASGERAQKLTKMRQRNSGNKDRRTYVKLKQCSKLHDFSLLFVQLFLTTACIVSAGGVRRFHDVYFGDVDANSKDQTEDASHGTLTAQPRGREGATYDFARSSVLICLGGIFTEGLRACSRFFWSSISSEPEDSKFLNGGVMIRPTSVETNKCTKWIFPRGCAGVRCPAVERISSHTHAQTNSRCHRHGLTNHQNTETHLRLLCTLPCRILLIFPSSPYPLGSGNVLDAESSETLLSTPSLFTRTGCNSQVTGTPGGSFVGFPAPSRERLRRGGRNSAAPTPFTATRTASGAATPCSRIISSAASLRSPLD